MYVSLSLSLSASVLQVLEECAQTYKGFLDQEFSLHSTVVRSIVIVMFVAIV